ncbi:MAG: hypothetical protein ACR2H5_06595 [Ktedonobacteraceae bacterium]
MAVMQTALDAPELNSKQLYRREFYSLSPRATGEEEQAIIAQARAGNQEARFRLVEDAMHYVSALAWKFAQVYERDYIDIVAQGNLLLVEHLDHALASDCLLAYLRTKAKYGLIAYCTATQTLITTPKDTGHGKKLKPLSVASLDSPITDDETILLLDTIEDPRSSALSQPAKDYTALYAAIDALPERQRDVVLRSFDLRDYEPQSLTQISMAWYGRKKNSTVSWIRITALKNLRALLADAYPQF